MPTPLTNEKFKDVIVVIPAYNEELVIGSVVLKVCRIVDRVIVVDDGSQDNTADVARLAGAEVIRIDENMGKAHALLLGLKRARELGCRVAVTFDGDGQHKSHDISTWKGSAYGVPFHLDDSGSAYRYPQMALLGSANRDHFFKIIHDKKICSSKSCTGSPISYPNFFILRTTISSSL